jgi:hypothetical protein
LIYSPDPPKFASLTPAPELRQIVASSWEALSDWTQQLSGSEVDRDAWPHDPQDLIARAGVKAGRPIADVIVHLEVLPVVGTQRWVLTEDPNRHFLHVIVTPAVVADVRLRDGWLLDALIRIG